MSMLVRIVLFVLMFVLIKSFHVNVLSRFFIPQSGLNFSESQPQFQPPLPLFRSQFSLNTMRDKSPSGHSLIFRNSLPLNKGEILSSSWINKNQHYISVGSESQMRWSVPRLLPWIVATRVCIAYQTNYCSCYTWTTLSLLNFQNTLLEYQFYFSPLRWTQRFLVIAFPREGLYW